MNQQVSRQFVKVADQAKLVRAALKESFPGIKFSVRSDSYAGGASIRIRYQDGPSFKLVNAVAQAFAGGYFDGMIDYKGSNYHTLDGKPVSFHGDFVFVERDHSDGQVRRAVVEVLERFGVELPADPVSFYRRGDVFRLDQHLQHRISELLTKLSDRFAAEPSPTLARLKPAGDDGYGHGTVGTAANPGGGKAYAAREEARERVRAMPELAGLEPQGRA